MPASQSNDGYLEPLYSAAGTDQERNAVTQLGKILAKVSAVQEESIEVFSRQWDKLDRAKSDATASIAGLKSRRGFSNDPKSKETLRDIVKFLEAT